MVQKKKKSKREDFKSIDKISKGLDKANIILLKTWKFYIYIVIAVIIIIIAILLYKQHLNSYNLTASKKFEAAKTIPQLQAVIKDYPSLSVSNIARIDLAAKLVNEKKYDEANELYNQIINNGQSNYLQAVAKLNQAYILEDQGKKEAAVNKFMEVADYYETPTQIKCEAQYSAGRIYLELNNKEQAIAVLKKASSVNANVCAGWPTLSQTLLDSINVK